MADRGMAGSRAKGAPTWMVLRTGRAEPIVNHRFSGIRDRSKRTGTGRSLVAVSTWRFLCRLGLWQGAAVHRQGLASRLRLGLGKAEHNPGYTLSD